MTDREALLLAYADGELGPEETQVVERLLESDTEAQEQLQIYRDTASLLRTACAESFYREASDQRVISLHEAKVCAARRTILAAAAAVLLGVVGFGAGYEYGERPPPRFEALIGDIAEYHNVYARDPSHLVEVPASRRADIEEWLGHSLGEKLTVPDLSAAGFRFVGGRLLVGGGMPVAQLLYTRPGTLPVGICIAALREGPSHLQVAHRDGLTLAGWREGDYTYVVVGDLAEPEMRSLAQRVAANSRG
jgi:anti-sigma factor RsiW